MHDRRAHHVGQQPAGEPVVLRNPDAVRPWQHVLNPLSGYLVLAEALLETGAGSGFDDAWNFGPVAGDEQPVSWVVERVRERWPELDARVEPDADAGKESPLLRLDSAKARERLEWAPRWDLAAGLDATIEWFRAHAAGEDARAATLRQIRTFA